MTRGTAGSAEKEPAGEPAAAAGAAAFKPRPRGKARTAAPPRVYSDQEAAAFLAGTIELSDAGVRILQAGEEVMYLLVADLPPEHRAKPPQMQQVGEELLAVPGIGAAFRRGGAIANIYTAVGEREPGDAAAAAAAAAAGPGLPPAASQELALFRRGAVTWSVPVANMRAFLVLGAGSRFVLAQVAAMKKKLGATIEKSNRLFEEVFARIGGRRHPSQSRSPRGRDT